MRVFRRIIWSFFLLLWLCAAALWARSYWKTDDLLLTYDGDGSAHLRVRSGMVTLIHVSPKSPVNRHAIQRVRIITPSEGTLLQNATTSQSYASREQWRSFRFDSITSAQITSIRAAYAARLASANQAAFAAARASDLAYIDFQDALYGGHRRANFTQRQDISIAYWQMQAARQHAAAMRAAKLQVAAAGVPSLRPQWQVIFPVWSVWATAAIPVVAPLLKVTAKRRRMQHGVCGHCGYNLHGNTSGICPECGTLLAAVLCRSITVEGKRVLSITPAIPAIATSSH